MAAPEAPEPTTPGFYFSCSRTMGVVPFSNKQTHEPMTEEEARTQLRGSFAERTLPHPPVVLAKDRVLCALFIWRPSATRSPKRLPAPPNDPPPPCTQLTPTNASVSGCPSPRGGPHATSE